MASSTDRDLIERTLRGDHRAFALLVDRYGRSVYTRIARHVSDPDDVDDLVQEVLLTAYTRLVQVQQRDRFPAWLTTIADNQVRMWWRRRYVQLRWEAMAHTAGEREPQDAHDEETSQELLSMLRHAVRRLSEAHRQVIIHHYLNGFTYQETASLLGLEVDTVRSRLQKARHRLKEEVRTMRKQTQGHQPQTFELTRADLMTLRWATRFASKDPDRPNLHGVYLDRGGRIIATDGYRLLVWASDALSTIAKPVLLGPWPESALPEVEQATLVIREHEAVIRGPALLDRSVPIMEAEFPHYEKVMPTAWPIQVTVTADRLRELIELLTNYLNHLTPRHPVEPEGHFLYRPHHPQIEVRLSMAEQTLSVFTTRQMGYFPTAKEYKTETPPPDGPDWTFMASIPVQIETTSSEDRLRIGVDFAYLRDALSVLEIHQPRTIRARFIDPEKAMIFASVDRPDQQALVMPLRITAA